MTRSAEQNAGLLTLLEEARACTACAPFLPLGPRPLLAASPRSRILIVGQAPGRAAHLAGVPWQDRSGARLREWLDVPDEVFYDPDQIALLPMGFCFPGTGTAGDLAPRPECAPLWHPQLLAAMPALRLTVYLGRYAAARYFGASYPDITSAVAAHAELLPSRIVLPHPSPRNGRWLRRRPWFEQSLLPALRARVSAVLANPS